MTHTEKDLVEFKRLDSYVEMELGVLLKLPLVEVTLELASREYQWTVRRPLLLRGMKILGRLNHEIAECIERDLYFEYQAPLYSLVLKDIEAINGTIDRLLWASYVDGLKDPLMVFKSRLRVNRDALSHIDRRILLEHTACMGHTHFEYALEMVHAIMDNEDFYELCRRYFRILANGYLPRFRTVLGSARLRQVDPIETFEHGIAGGPIPWRDFERLLGRYYSVPKEFTEKIESLVRAFRDYKIDP